MDHHGNEYSSPSSPIFLSPYRVNCGDICDPRANSNSDSCDEGDVGDKVRRKVIGGGGGGGGDGGGNDDT